MQITVTCELTAKNLEILKQLCAESCEGPSKPIEKPINEHPVETPFPEPQGFSVPQAEEPHTEAPAKTYSKTDVKAVCLKLSKAGRQEELKAAFAKFGAKKLTEVAEADYPALMEALGANE